MAFKYSAKAFVKVYRKFIEWEWYTDTNTKALFLHCLLRANWESGKWKGINYEAGEFITSLPSLSNECGMSIQAIRTSLEKLVSTGELTSRTTDKVTGKTLSKCRIITVNNWNKYQGDNSQNNSQTNRQSNRTATGKQQASNSSKRIIKNNKEEKKKKEEAAVAAVPPSEGFHDDDEGMDPMEALRLYEQSLQV